VRCMLPLVLLGCGPLDEPVPADDLCTSYTREVHSSQVVETWVDVLPGNLEVRRDVVLTSPDGTWLADTTSVSYRDGRGRLAQRHLDHDSIEPHGDGGSTEVFEWDDAGRLARTVLVTDDGYEKVSTLRYDALGRQVRVDVRRSGLADQWHETVYEDGRVARSTTWSDGEDVPDYELVYTYLCAAPCLDADVESTQSGVLFQRWTERYQDGLVVEMDFAGVGYIAPQTIRFRYDGEGRKVVQQKTDADGDVTVQTWDYDPEGRLHRTRTGPDTDGDFALDSVDDEQIWLWTCR